MQISDKADQAAKELILLIGSNIRTIRKQKGITQEQLSEVADINEKFLSSVENGKETNLSVGYIMSIAIALDVTFEDLISTDPKGV